MNLKYSEWYVVSGKAPSLILIKGLKNGNPGLNIMPDLIIYDEYGKYTKEARIQYSMDL